MNLDVMFIPMVGTWQLLYLPMFVDQYMFGSMRTVRFIGPVSQLVNSIALAAPGVFRLFNAVNEKVVTFTDHNKLVEFSSYPFIKYIPKQWESF